MYLGTFENDGIFMEYFKQPNIMFLPLVIPNEILLSRLFENVWTFWNDGRFIWKCSHILKNMCTHIRENCRFVQKVQPKVTKVELFEGIFLKKDMCNICLLSFATVWGICWGL